MLNYSYSTDLQKLAAHLVRQLDTKPPQNPLSPEVFVVQNHGMAQWLTFTLTEKRGVTANLKFEFPAERIWSLIRIMDPDVPVELPSDRQPMAWAIMQILRTAGDSELTVLHQYYEESDAAKQEMRMWQLSNRVADVFDQYLTYRPEMLLKWERGRLDTNEQGERWQAVLWRKMVDHWQKSGNEYLHRANLQQILLEAIDSESIDPEKLPQRVSVFGVSAMPPIYLEILVRLSKLTDVHFYSLEFEGKNDNPLQESLCKTGREYLQLLEKFMAEEGVNVQKNDLRERPERSRDEQLQQFKNHLLFSESVPDDSKSDGTIQIHSCHSPRREVEVLYDRLLAMFEEDESLNPTDILVVAPDIENYAPEIESVFGAPEEGLPNIPYHLADRSTPRSNSFEGGVIKLLNLIESRFKVTDAIDLLDSRPIRDRFKFTDENLNTLERWIDDNRIRWGIDASYKASLNLPETDSFTWRAGLNRMILGYAMRSSDDELYEGIYPYQGVEQSEDTLLAGRFSFLMNQLFNFHKQVQQPKTLAEWSELLQQRITDFFPDNEEYFREMQRVTEFIGELKGQQALSGLQGKLCFRVMRSYLTSVLEQQQTGGGRTGQGITFSSMVPMRNIPVKVICLLGMDDGVFPKSKIPVAFDLMNRSPRPGDRSHSDEDRQLFWETIIAAQERIYISYVGQSNRQDSELPPSVVIRELLDYLTEIFNTKERDFLISNRLQPFSPAYFTKSAENKLFSYSAVSKNIAEQLLRPGDEEKPFLTSKLPEPDESYKRLSIDELIRFFQHPAKYLLQQRFGLYLREDNILDEDRENFQLSGLDGYQIGQELLQRYLNRKSLESFKEKAFAADLVPEGWPGDAAFERKTDEVLQFGSLVKEILEQEKLDPVEINLEIDDFRLTGKLDQIYGQEQLFYRFGRMRPKDLIELWLSHLAFQLVKPHGHSGQSTLYTFGKKGGVTFYQLNPISDSTVILQKLLATYWKGLMQNTYFFPESSFAFAERVQAPEKGTEEGFSAAMKAWKDEYSSYPKEGDDPYNKLLVNTSNPLENKRFQDISKSFWKPFFDVLNKEGN